MDERAAPGGSHGFGSAQELRDPSCAEPATQGNGTNAEKEASVQVPNGSLPPRYLPPRRRFTTCRFCARLGHVKTLQMQLFVRSPRRFGAGGSRGGTYLVCAVFSSGGVGECRMMNDE